MKGLFSFFNRNRVLFAALLLALLLLVGSIRLASISEGPLKLLLISSTYTPALETGEIVEGGIRYGNLVAQKEGSSLFGIDQNRILATSGSSFQLLEGLILVREGIVFFDAKSSVNLDFGNSQLNIEGLAGVFDAKRNSFIIFSGELDLGNDVVVGMNSEISLGENGHEVKKFERSLLSNNRYEIFLKEALEYGILPESLTDIKAPPINSVKPRTGRVVGNKIKKVTVSGETESGSTIVIKGNLVEVNAAGRFSTELSLKVGKTTFNIKATDSAGNSRVKTYSYTRETSQVTASGGGSTSGGGTSGGGSGGCTGSSFNTQMLNLINNHRANNGKSSLVLTSTLINVACDHSQYMKNLGSINHDNFAGRCSGKCDAENVAYNSIGCSANALFTQWKNSVGHNTNMLGSHTKLGAGCVNGYATTVFY